MCAPVPRARLQVEHRGTLQLLSMCQLPGRGRLLGGDHPLKGWATSLELPFKDTPGSDPLPGLVQ